MARKNLRLNFVLYNQAATQLIATRGRNIRYRVAASPGWQCCFTLLFDKTIVSRTEMEAVVIDAGKLVGLADGRSLGFGRFALKQFSLTVRSFG